jgi:RimJ/RimL family protein N-acetyltransferase
VTNDGDQARTGVIVSFVTVRALDPGEIDIYRTVRLEALRSDPDAFASTYEREAAFDDGTWRSRLEGFAGRPGRVFVGELDGAVVGMAGIGHAVQPGDTALWGMWVRAGARGTGIARELLDAVVGWARAELAQTVTLWVVRDNIRAVRLYERAGFEPTGDAQALPSNPCVNELAMRLVL